MNVDEIVSTLKLEPHPEGGAYRETYRSSVAAQTDAPRSVCTAIYFLLHENQQTQWHSVTHDEIYHFYAGGALELSLISPAGEHSIHKLGIDLAVGERPQVTIPGGYWQSAKTANHWSLIGCTVSPGFDFKDFELSDPVRLRKQFPHLTW